MSALPRSVSRFLLSLVTGLALTFALRAAAPPDLLGTEWSLWGSSKTSIKGYGSATVPGVLYVEITDDGELIVSDCTGVAIHGQYEVDGRGRPQAVITGDDLEEFFREGLRQLGAGALLGAMESLEFSGIKTSLTASENTKGAKLAFSLRFKATMVVDNGEKLVTLVMTCTLSGKAATSNQVEDVAGCTLTLAGKHAFSAGRAKVSGAVEQTLYFGPNGSQDLAAHEYLLCVGEQVVIRGHYALVDKKVCLDVTSDGIDAGAEYYEDLAQSAVPLEYFYPYCGMGTLVGSLGRDGRMTLKGAFRFDADMDYGDDMHEVSGKYSFTTTETGRE
jgi:hypothetical protein